MIKSNTNNHHITWSEALNTIISGENPIKLKDFLDKHKISYPKEINCTEDSIVSLESQMLIDTVLINNCYQPIFVKTVSYSTLNQYLMFMKMYFQENQLKIFEDKFKEVFDKWFNVQKYCSSNVSDIDNIFKDCLKYDEDDVVLDIEKIMKEVIRDLSAEFGPLQQSVQKDGRVTYYIFASNIGNIFYRIRVFEGIAASTNEYIYYIDLEKVDDDFPEEIIKLASRELCLSHKLNDTIKDSKNRVIFVGQKYIGKEIALEFLPLE
jgi:hypothetical protein